MQTANAVWLVAAFVLGAVLCGGTIRLLQPFWQQYAIAKPNARSSHMKPTPQGGGIAVMLAVFVVALVPMSFASPLLPFVVLGALLLTALGAIDDLRALDAVLRLTVQAVAALIVLAALPSDLRVVPAFPWWIERIVLAIAVLWFVNLVNFMDGIDWMTVAEVVPVTAALALFGLTGALPHDATLAAFALCGAMIGFAPFNRPVARLFLGDVGSLPVGLLLGWLLILLAGHGHVAAALLLPLYYLADATITLLHRLAKGEPIMQAHRSHFYQRALDTGSTVYGIVTRVFAANIGLAALAALTLTFPSMPVQLIALTIGAALVAALLFVFSRVSPRKLAP
ncbi:MAG TPA: glycosyl transferase [Pseudolabrys sp.]|nr:glycosyl transferase [Pseudolabrys sp.]